MRNFTVRIYYFITTKLLMCPINTSILKSCFGKFVFLRAEEFVLIRVCRVAIDRGKRPTLGIELVD